MSFLVAYNEFFGLLHCYFCMFSIIACSLQPTSESNVLLGTTAASVVPPLYEVALHQTFPFYFYCDLPLIYTTWVQRTTEYRLSIVASVFRQCLYAVATLVSSTLFICCLITFMLSPSCESHVPWIYFYFVFISCTNSNTPVTFFPRISAWLNALHFSFRCSLACFELVRCAI